MIRRLKKDVLSELPPKRRQRIQVATDKSIVEKVQKYLTILTREYNTSISTFLSDKSNLENLEKHNENL